MPDTDKSTDHYAKLGVAMCHALSQAGKMTFQCTQGEAQRPLQQFIESLRIGGFNVVLEPIETVNSCRDSDEIVRVNLHSRYPEKVQPEIGEMMSGSSNDWFVNRLADALDHEGLIEGTKQHDTTVAEGLMMAFGDQGIALIRCRPNDDELVENIANEAVNHDEFKPVTASPEILAKMLNVSPDAVRRAAVTGEDMIFAYSRIPGAEGEGSEIIDVLYFIGNLFRQTPAARARFEELFDRSVSPYAADHQFQIGDLTMAKVFKANGIKNLYDLQPVLDAVERALVGVGPGLGIIADVLEPELTAAAGTSVGSRMVADAAKRIFGSLDDAGFKIVLK